MATVGSIIIKIGAGTADFTKDISGAGKSLEEFGGKAGSTSGILSGLAEGFGIGAGIEVVKGGFELASKAVEKFVEIGTEAIKTVAEWSLQALESAERTATLTQSIGVSAETIQGMSHAAKNMGGSAEEVDGALLKFTKSLGQFAAKGQESTELLEHFGINMKELVNLSPDEALRKVADSISQIHNQSQRAVIVTELFGKSAGKLAPLFEQGAKGIDEAIKKGLQFGDVLSTTNVSKLVAANESVNDLSRAFEGVKNSVAIGAAPVIKAIAEHIQDLAPSGVKMQAVMTVAFDAMIELGAYVVDTMAHIGGWLLQGAADAQFLEASILSAMGEGQAAAEARQLGESMQSWAKAADNINTSKGAHQFIAGLHNDIDDAGKHIETKLRDSAKVGTEGFIENIKKASEVLAGLKKEVAEFGKTEAEKKLIELKADGASPAQLAQGKEYAKQLHTLEAHKAATEAIKQLQEEIASKSGNATANKAAALVAAGASNADLQAYTKLSAQLKEIEDQQKRMEKAKEIWKDAESPIEKYNDKLKELNELLEHGALNQHQFDEARKKAAQELGKAEKEGADKKAELVERRFDFRLPSQAGRDPKAEALNIAKQQLQYHQKWDQLFKDIWQQVTGTNAPVLLDITL
jgi:hypothetical protein